MQALLPEYFGSNPRINGHYINCLPLFICVTKI